MKNIKDLYNKMGEAAKKTIFNYINPLYDFADFVEDVLFDIYDIFKGGMYEIDKMLLLKSRDPILLSVKKFGEDIVYMIDTDLYWSSIPNRIALPVIEPVVDGVWGFTTFHPSGKPLFLIRDDTDLADVSPARYIEDKEWGAEMAQSNYNN